MGRRQRKKHYFNHENRVNNSTRTKNENLPYDNVIKENENFVQYYKTLNVCKLEEFEDFITSLKTDLPATFRITGSKVVANRMLKIVENQLVKDCIDQDKTEDEPEKSPRIFPIPWYPNKLAWQMELSRKDIRRCEAFYKLHNFLVSETENGTISRQETVSMIPPLLLDVQSHHKILDMCAAPGSKTAQLLELLHATDEPIPSGYVVANDIDNKRCYMLVHQAKRLNSPCVVVINHDSAILPNLMTTLNDGSLKQVHFDRILCDVPCSGDGTLRKNPDIWTKWTAANGLNLHGVQIRILRRGVEMLEEGGKLVYSTCSLNPIENEAVIHRILVETNGALELLDVSESLPGLKYSPGMEDWLVSSRNLEFYKSFDDVPENWSTTIRPFMFPPNPSDRHKYNLNRCIRILPHQQNTGAFFVAVLRKVKPINPKINFNINRDPENQTEGRKRELDEKLPQNQRKRRRKEGYRENPFVFFKKDEAVWNEIKEFYQVEDKFDPSCLLTRCSGGKKKNVYLTSEAVKNLVESNQEYMKFINTGVKSFVRCDNKNMKCSFRIANDALETLNSYIGDNRRIRVPKDDLITLLLHDPQNPAPIDSLSADVQKQVADLTPGSCILVYREECTDDIPLILNVSGWRGTTSLRCYMDKYGSMHLLRLLGGDFSKFDINKFKTNVDKEGITEEDKEEDSNNVDIQQKNE